MCNSQPNHARRPFESSEQPLDQCLPEVIPNSVIIIVTMEEAVPIIVSQHSVKFSSAGSSPQEAVAEFLASSKPRFQMH